MFHDDQHGTAVVVLAALRNACTGGRKVDGRFAGGALGRRGCGVAITKYLMEVGVDDIVAADRKGAINQGREGLEPSKQWLADHANPDRAAGSCQEMLPRGRRVHRRQRARACSTGPMWRPWPIGSIVFGLANPVPEMLPEEAQGAVAVMATGRSDYPNQINNVLCFPGIFPRRPRRGGDQDHREHEAGCGRTPSRRLCSRIDLRRGRDRPERVLPGVARRSPEAVAAAALADGVTR